MKIIITDKIREILVDIIAGSFVFLLIYAAFSKLLDFDKFQIELGKSPIISPIFNFVAIATPSVEIGISVLLIIKRFRYLGLSLSYSLMMMFSTYIILILRLGTDIPCTCGGILETLSWNQHLVFNIFFIVLATAGILLTNVKKSLLQ